MGGRVKSPLHFRLSECVLVLMIAFSGISLGFSGGGFIVNFDKLGFTVFSSLQKAVHAVENVFTGTVTAVRDMAHLRSEFQQLTEKLKDYEFLQRNNTEIRKENERLKEQLDFATEIKYRNIPAQIIGRNPDSQYSGITLNKGARNGIKKGMPVIAVQAGNVGVVGRIITVGVGTSMMMPVYDLRCNISSRIQNTRDLGIVSGNGSSDGALSLKYIRKRVMDDFNYGDIVVTSGENGNYMRDIPVGRISKITVLDYDSSLNIELDPIIDFNRLENVLVIDQYNENDREAQK
ncbi:rod shape-determining protein MreC [uncultured Treponema sp.]|uniref:rod shape-determining protein MreC n=1 Tax=uncultured Treponema sp. TaxID=162155 RepID=UPI002599CDD7|nr:rod shape-determining protein MreC [uncultured Treponema sp.]